MGKNQVLFLVLILIMLVSIISFFILMRPFFREGAQQVLGDCQDWGCNAGQECVNLCESERLDCETDYECVPKGFEWCHLPVPSGCVQVEDPVIASDNKGYKNSCYACKNPGVIWFLKVDEVSF